MPLGTLTELPAPKGATTNAIQILKNLAYIFCDIDGTLTGNNGRGHSSKLLDTLQRLMSHGLKIGLVSGRETLTVLAVHRIFDLNGPIISENGAELVLDPRHDETQRMKIGGLSLSQIATITQRLEAHGFGERCFIDPEKKHLVTLYPNEFPRHRPEDLPILCERVIAVLQPLANEIEISYSSAAIDICARGVNKGTGIQKMCETLFEPLSVVAFVGDSVNDLPAFEVVSRGGGWVALVRNEPAVKSCLQTCPRVYYARASASEGAVKFLEFFSRHRNL
ncbi:MAG: HAD family hydrolase [candidate division KSB1 bacterium]